jgi:tetraacyldisaccharide 4'-kinase
LILQVLSAAYGAGAAWRRRWYAADPRRRQRLGRPVISVGNLTVGGSGKTPVVEALARLLVREGERPAILTRGYARPRPRGGVTVVSDPSRVVATYADAGDEPLMLARALPGVPVLVGVDRAESGRYAEARFDTTIHILDDGFQHLTLERDLDLLLVDARVLDERMLPAGRLREPIAAARCADAVLVTHVRLKPDAAYGPEVRVDPDTTARDGTDEARVRQQANAPAEQLGRTLGVNTAFAVTRTIGDPPDVGKDRPVFAVAGVARPERFFADLRDVGWQVSGTIAFRDHHRFTANDIDRIRDAASAAGAELVLTTAKDAIRLESVECDGIRFAAVPLTARIEPAERFHDWLITRLRQLR